MTTQSILEAFLLQQTALDDTLLRDELLEDLDLANGSGAKGKQRHSLAWVLVSPYHPRRPPTEAPSRTGNTQLCHTSSRT